MSENWRLLIPSIYTEKVMMPPTVHIWWRRLFLDADLKNHLPFISYINFEMKKVLNKNTKTGETSMLGGEEPRRCHPNALWQDLTVESGVEVARLDTAWTQGRPLTGHHTSTATQQEKKVRKKWSVCKKPNKISWTMWLVGQLVGCYRQWFYKCTWSKFFTVATLLYTLKKNLLS